VSATSTPGFSGFTLLLCLLTVGCLLMLFSIGVSVEYHRRKSNQEKMKALRAITRERAKAERTLNSISEAVISVDDDYEVVYVNDAARLAAGAKGDDLIGTNIDSSIVLYEAENTGAEFDMRGALEALDDGQRETVDVLLFDNEGNSQAMQLSLMNLTDNQFGASRFTVVLRDVSAERALTRELEYQASHDSLTGCWNRYYFEKRLQILIESSQRRGMTHALVYMDLDQFKIVNDTCGHSAGDRLLIELTNNLNAILRPGDILARLGGDEFGLLVVNVSHEEAINVAERIYEFYQNSMFYHEGQAFPVRSSIGFVPIDNKSGAMNDVLSAADIAWRMPKSPSSRKK